MTIVAVATGLALAILVAAAVIDVIRYEIPDAASIGVMLLAAVAGLATPSFGWMSHVAATIAMFAFGLLAFSRNWLGGGDVKLMTAVAAWTGLAGLPVMFVAVSIAGGGLALVYAVGRRLVGSTSGNATSDPPIARLPYAVAILIGTVWWAWVAGPAMGFH